MIVRLSGGLGNQMFQYAFGLAAAQEWGEPLYIDTFAYLRDRARCYELSKLNVDAKKIGFIKQLKYNLNIFSKGCIEYEHTLFGTQNLNKNKEYFFGCWQNVMYFKEIKVQLNSIYTCQCKNVNVSKIAEEMKHTASVAIHVRHGDYTRLENIYVIQSIRYYMEAMEYIENRIKSPQYYIFSDDIDYVKAHFQKSNMHIVDWNAGKDCMYDMELMSHCAHNICANSTFSIWGARLNKNPNKVMIRPLHHDNYETMQPAEIQENWKGWILIDADGKIY